MSQNSIDDAKLSHVSGGTIGVEPKVPSGPSSDGTVIGGISTPIGGQPKPESEGTGSGNQGVTG